MKLLCYIGGKYYIADWIISHFPPHHCFVDVFGGSGIIIFKKPPSPVEIYNDKWNLVVNFLLQVRDNPDKLMQEVEKLPYSKTLYYELINKLQNHPEKLSNLEKAVYFFYVINSSFDGILGSGWSYSIIKNKAKTYYRKIPLIKQYSNRFKNVIIECADFRNIIQTYDSKDTLFYIDPPYFGTEDYYYGNFTEQDHIDLANILNKIKGKAVISYYPHPKLQELYPNWYISQKTVPRRSLHYTKQNKTSIELLLTNFNTNQQSKLFNTDNLTNIQLNPNNIPENP